MSREWEAAKEAAEKTKRGDEEKREALAELKGAAVGGEGNTCVCQCDIKVRFGLPSRHLLWPYHNDNEPIPAELFHCRWFLDHRQERGVDHKRGRSDSGERGRWDDDRYRDQGATATYFHAQRSADFQASFDGSYREQFAQAVRQTSEALIAEGQRQQQNRGMLPQQLPEPPQQPQVRPSAVNPRNGAA